MYIAPFTLQEACALALKFKHLERKTFRGVDGGLYNIMITTFAPYGDVHAIKVAELLFKALNKQEEHSANQILNYINSYRGKEFDVLALSVSLDDERMNVEARSIQLTFKNGQLEYNFCLPFIDDEQFD